VAADIALAAVQLEGRPDANSGTRPQEVRTVTAPLTADLRSLHVTVSRQFLDKLAAARDALSHSRPGASDEEILAAGLDLLLARDAKRKGRRPPVVRVPQRARCAARLRGRVHGSLHAHGGAGGGRDRLVPSELVR
jgi:hypothetical protein